MSAAPEPSEAVSLAAPPEERSVPVKRWTWRRVHTWIGIGAAITLLVISMTGVALSFRKSFKKPDPKVPPALQGKPALAPMEIVALAEKMGGAPATELYFTHDAEDPYCVVLGDPRQTELWYAASGELLETRYGTDRTVMQWIFLFHTGAIIGRPGEYVSAVSGVALFALLVSGVVIWPWRLRRAAEKRRAKRE